MARPKTKTKGREVSVFKNNNYWKEQQVAPVEVWGGEAGANIMSNYIELEIKHYTPNYRIWSL